jgi:hypothetical protein
VPQLELPIGRDDVTQPLASDYVRDVFAYFTTRRARGTDLSAIDEELLLSWEREGVPLAWVIEGIDHTFARLVEPPASLAECAASVRRIIRAHGQAVASGGGRQAPAPVETTDAAPPTLAPASAAWLTDEPDVVRRLRERAARLDGLLAAAHEEVLQQWRALPDAEAVDAERLAELDERVEAALLARLDAAQLREVSDEAATQLRAEGRVGDPRATRRARSRALRQVTGYVSLFVAD